MLTSVALFLIILTVLIVALHVHAVGAVQLATFRISALDWIVHDLYRHQYYKQISNHYDQHHHLLLTLTDATQEILIDLVYGWID